MHLDVWGYGLTTCCCTSPSCVFASRSTTPPYGRWSHVPPHVGAGVQEEILVDDEMHDGEVCAVA